MPRRSRRVDGDAAASQMLLRCGGGSEAAVRRRRTRKPSTNLVQHASHRHRKIRIVIPMFRRGDVVRDSVVEGAVPQAQLRTHTAPDARDRFNVELVEEMRVEGRVQSNGIVRSRIKRRLPESFRVGTGARFASVTEDAAQPHANAAEPRARLAVLVDRAVVEDVETHNSANRNPVEHD